MSRAVSPSAARVYGLARVTRCWKVSRASLYRHRQAAPVSRCRPGPVGPCDDATLVEHIKQVIAESRFTGEGYRKIWARLRFSGIRSSPGRIRRLMRENGLLAPHRVRKRTDKAHDGTITTDAVDVLWGTDMTQTITVAQGVAHVFVAVDHLHPFRSNLTSCDGRGVVSECRHWIIEARRRHDDERREGHPQQGRRAGVGKAAGQRQPGVPDHGVFP
jgi:hypothetical protein